MDTDTSMTYRHLINFWPLVPALDIQSIMEPNISNYQNDEPFFSLQSKNLNFDSGRNTDECNCLIIGDGIGCLSKTIARMYRHNSVNLNIYSVSSFKESLARDLLFLSLFDDISVKLSFMERAETFLEILGNTQIRASTKQFVVNKSAEIVEHLGILTDNKNIIQFVSLDYLKQREIDDLLQVFNYLKDETEVFCIAKGWNSALRSCYGTRYDCRKNLFDYHFNMKLADYRMINLKKYIDWCETGVAFKFRQSKYNYPNKTMHIATPDEKQDTVMYFGDIATSPYVVFGVETGNESMLRTVNGEYQSTSEDISKFNLIDMINEFISCAKKQDPRNVMVHLLFFETFYKMHKFSKFFDAVYVSCDMMPRVGPLLGNILKESGIVVFETIQNVVNSTKEQKAMYCDAIHELAYSNGLETLQRTDFENNENYKIFILNEDRDFVSDSLCNTNSA